jgi:tripeptide aminopeptidase
MNLDQSAYKELLINSFDKYVRIYTESDFHSKSFPSTERQKDLSKLLTEELIGMGVEASLDENGYVYGKIPANTNKKVPKIFFCSHVDTSPDCSGKDVIPRIHKNYQGQDIDYPNDEKLKLNPEISPKLTDKMGHDIITASGGTLLGADNKSGVAAIMTAVKYLTDHPEIKHGPVRILFTPDEEVGRGVDHLDKEALDADFGYTMDGEQAGTFNWETFSADYAKVVVHGVSIHPGYAKDKMVNAVKVASDFIEELPEDRLSPETTTNREPFVHPVRLSGNAEKAEIEFILRDFNTKGLKDLRALLEKIASKTEKEWPGSKIEIEFKEQYRNMREVLEKHPEIVEYAVEAIEKTGLICEQLPIRGGTDGSRLSFMGLPCPNIFVGEYHFHSPLEWTSVQDMLKATETIIHLLQIWEQRS